MATTTETAAPVDLDALEARLTSLRSQNERLQREKLTLQRRIAILRAATTPQAPGPSRYGLFVVGALIASPIGWMVGRLLGG